MTKWLAVLLWPAGVAVIFCAAALLARRLRSVSAAAGPQSSGSGRSARSGDAAAGHRDLPSASRRIIRFFLVVLAGAAVVYGVMVLLALAAVHGGPVIDKPIFHWTATHQLAHWTKQMKRATEVGDRYPIWAAGAMAAVCMAITWRRDRWLPPVAIGTALVLARYLTRAINHTIHRVPPPGAGGIFPSGGCARAVFIYGLIGYLLWREFGGATPAARRRAAIWTGAVVAALGFNEGYSRGYLAVHWFTDICGGLIYGCLLLYLFVTAVRLTAGPAPAPTMAADRAFVHASPGGAHVRRDTRPEHVNTESRTAQSVSASGGE